MAAAREATMKKDSWGDVRKSVIWIGTAPNQETCTELKNRGLIVQACEGQAGVERLPLARAIVLSFEEGRDKDFQSSLNKITAQAQDHGLMVLAVANSDKEFLLMDEILKTIHPGARPEKRITRPPYVIAELIARHDAGPSAGDVEVLGAQVPETTRLFLRRAFNDCKSISIRKLAGGRSARVFSVYALFRDSRVGPRPLPFFAKVDKKAKILNEWSRYQNPVGHFIPFQARPDLEPERCFTGSTQGILVGNFVEHSESLWEVAKRGAAQPVIYSLFDEALRGWRLQAYAQDDAAAFADSLWASLTGLWDLTRCIPQLSRRATDASKFGKVHSPQELLDMLKAFGTLRHRLAPCHGDLHIHNVRARRGEAILIDFNSARFSGPLVADPASLEVSLVFEMDSTDADNEGWRELAHNLYESQYLHRAPPPPKEPAAREWMWACVRQIRLIALESQETDREYHYALIWYLLRRAAFRNENARDKFRRDFAYYLACRLVASLEEVLRSSEGSHAGKTATCT
jgi:hypothetical protein